MLRVAAVAALVLALGGAGAFHDPSRGVDPSNDAPLSGPTPPRVALQLSLDDPRPAAEVEERFLSFAIDTAQVVGGEFWAPPGSGEGLLKTHTVRRYDFERPRLRNLASALAPAYLRIGGTAADWTVYRMDDASASAPLPKGARWALTRPRWDEVNQFARDMNFRLMFTLNAGPGARDAGGRWDPQSARPLIRYSQERGYPVDVWELGNELNAFPVVHRSWLSVDRYVDDLAQARALLDGIGTSARLAGLSSSFWPVMGEWRAFTEPVLRRAGGLLDIVTWHYYPTQSARCPIATRRARAGVLPDARHLADVDRWAELVGRSARAHAPRAAVWLGETGSAQCGGEQGFSNSFADALWWLDELGRVARRGQGVVVRQTLSGSDYGLIDDVTTEPNPSYWASWLWRSFMGRRVLAVAETPAAPALRAYAHCLRDDAGGAGPALGQPGAVALLLINLDPAQPVAVALPAPAAGGARVVRLEADGLEARQVRLDGAPLRAGSDGHAPPVPGLGDGATIARGGPGLVTLAPHSAAFVLVPGAAAAACASN
jgi:heparanase 1